MRLPQCRVRLNPLRRGMESLKSKLVGLEARLILAQALLRLKPRPTRLRQTRPELWGKPIALCPTKQALVP